ncbi:dihydropteroate synthase [Escherichia coli]
MNKSLIIFGIVNITSDSFSDGGRYLAPDAAIAQARKLMAEGADVIDLGPASSNPDAAPVASRHRNRAYRAGAGRAQGRWHSRLARQLSTRDASLCLVAWCGLSQ